MSAPHIRAGCTSLHRARIAADMIHSYQLHPCIGTYGAHPFHLEHAPHLFTSCMHGSTARYTYRDCIYPSASWRCFNSARFACEASESIFGSMRLCGGTLHLPRHRPPPLPRAPSARTRDHHHGGASCESVHHPTLQLADALAAHRGERVVVPVFSQHARSMLSFFSLCFEQ